MDNLYAIIAVINHQPTTLEDSTYWEPVNAEHSIQEAIVALILDGQVTDWARFDQLEPIRPYFNANEGVIHTTFGLTYKKNEIRSEVYDHEDKRVGFRSVKKVDGNDLLAFSIINGISLQGKATVSLNSFEYTRWSSFINTFKEILEQLEHNLIDLKAQTAVIQYTDVFKWNSDKEAMKVEELFSTDSEYFPAVFQNIETKNYSLTLERKGNPFTRATEILKIKRNEAVGFDILHQLAIPLTELQIVNLKKNHFLFSLIDQAHVFNKEMLMKLLTRPIQSRIGLLN